MKKLLVGMAGFFYTISPIDFIPDVIPILGWLDDVGVIAFVIHYLGKAQEHVREVRKAIPISPGRPRYVD